MKTLQKNQSGVTLVEMIVYIAIASIVLGAIGTVYTTIVALRVKNQAVLEVEQQGQHMMQAITLAVRNAASISAPAAGASAASASLSTYAAGTTPTVFSITNGVLNIREGSTTAIPLSTSDVSVSDLNFQNITRTGTDGMLRITFTVTYVNPTGRTNQSVTRTFTNSAAVRGMYP